jgi:hypothetical protein
MQQYRPEFEIARPAPFPIYGEDRRRLWLERGLRLLGSLLLLWVFIPGTSRPFSPLTIPVFYDRIELEQRSPVALRLDLPKADYQVSPVGLGYFDEQQRFIYTADVSRGLIYGRNRQGVIAIELSAPSREPVYLEDRLERIRGRVVNINDIKNRLRLRRLSFEEGRNSFEESVDELWNGNTGDSGIPELETLDWEMQRLFPGRELEAARVLTDRARNLAELKQLWYESQFARLDLLVEQFDLQLGLAELPRQQFEELLSLGNTHLVRETMSGEIERLRTSWQDRGGILQLEMASDVQLVGEPEQPARGLAIPQPGLATSTGGLSGPGTEGAARYADAGKPQLNDRLLRESLAQTRTQVASAEMEMIRRGMQKLDDATRHVQAGVLPSWTEIREIAVQPVRLELPSIEELDLFARVGDSAVNPEQARDLLLDLNRSFEEDLNEELHEYNLSWGGEQENRELTNNQLAYGLLAVDTSTRSAGSAQQRSSAGNLPLADLLADILDSPQGYDVSQYELGYLKFMKWYAELDPNDGYGTLSSTPRRNFGK